MTAPTWGVVGTMDEPPELVAAYAAHHLWAGARSVHIYLDRDNARTRALLSQLSGVCVTVADEDYWRSEFDIKVPKTHQRRQTLNATHAYTLQSVDYLLHLDADEFLVQAQPIEIELRRLKKLRPRNYLSIPNVERVWRENCSHTSMFAGSFRGSTKRSDRDLSALTLDREGLTRFGLTGHSAGKACSPTGQNLVLGIHRPHHDTPRPWTYPGVRRSTTSMILHFDGMTRLHWVYKRLRKSLYLSTHSGQPVSPQMQAQIDAIEKNGGGIAAANALHDRIKVLKPDLEVRLEEKGLLLNLDFDPERALTQLLPHEQFDLSSARFDQWLGAEKSAILDNC